MGGSGTEGVVTFQAGDPVKVQGKRGYFMFLFWWTDNRIAAVYGGTGGGDQGQRQHYAVLADQLSPDRRRTSPKALAAEHREKVKARGPHR